MTTNMTGPPQNIWIICITIEHKSSCNTFFNILQKYYQFPILGTLNLMFICIQNMNSIPDFFFRYCREIGNLLLWVLWECLIMSINNDSITLQESLISKVLKSACKKLTSSLLFSDILKTLQTCYFGNDGNAWTSPSKSFYQFVGSYTYLHAKNQLHHSVLS